jgi:hypothetical protein
MCMCKIEGCDAKPVAKGLCLKHYMRERRTGHATATHKRGRPAIGDGVDMSTTAFHPRRE